jgi:Baseplate J-like protein
MATGSSNYVPQIDFTSRDYAAIRDDLYALIPIFSPNWTSRNPADLGIAILEIFAHMGDVLNYYIDRAANEAFITTASQRTSVQRIAKMLGYTPTDANPSTVTLTFSNTNTVATDVPYLTQCSSTAVINGSNTEIIFETNSDLMVPAASTATGVLVPGTATVVATQGFSVTNEQVGTSTGIANQAFTLSQYPVIANSVQVTINNTNYNYVTFLLESYGTDPAFTTTTDANGITSVQFGDGVGGRIPPANATIYVTYRVGGGVSGNVNAATITNIVNPISGVTVTNILGAAGGADAESTDSIRVNAPLAFSSSNRAVTLGDFASLAVGVSGVAKASASGSLYTSINLYIAPNGDTGVNSDGTLSAVFQTLATNINTYFAYKTPPNTTITLLPPTFVGVNITVVVTALPQYKNSTISTNVTKALNALLDFNAVSFNDHIALHDVISTIATVEGVYYSNVTLLARADGTQSGTSDLSFLVNEIPQVGTLNIASSGGIAQ